MNVGIAVGRTNIRTVFDVCQRVLEYFVCYRGQRLSCTVFQLLKIVVFDLEDEVRHYLNPMMPGGLIGRGAPIAWPPKSPDLTPLDFFVLWADAKNVVC
jgi:hypothetical protein